jgi:hypothetical protein
VTLADEIGNLEEKIIGFCWLGAIECAMGEVQTGQEHLIEALKTAYAIQSTNSTIILLNLGVLMAKLSDAINVTEAVNLQQKTKALELFTLVSSHPATWQIFRNKAALLQAKLATQLPPEIAVVARERGKSRTLEDAVKRILEELT